MRPDRAAWLCLVVGHAVLTFYFVDARFTANPLSRALPIVSLFEEGTLRIPAALESARTTLGSPWQKDHKLAAAAALVALHQ